MLEQLWHPFRVIVEENEALAHRGRVWHLPDPTLSDNAILSQRRKLLT